ATTLMEAACFTLFLAAFGLGLWREGYRLPRWVAWPVLAFVAWTLFQVLPLPPAVLGILSPGTHAAYQRFLPGYAGSASEADLEAFLKNRNDDSHESLQARSDEKTGLEGVMLLRPGWRPISWYPWQTALWLSRFLAYAAFALLIVACLPPRALERRLPWFVLVLGSGLSLQGILQYFSWNGKILWVVPVYQGHPFGPFVNSNHFSGLVEMALPLGCGLVLREAGFGSTRRRRRRTLRSAAPRVVLGLFLLLPMLVALVLAYSRGGMFSLALVGCVYFGLQALRLGDPSARRGTARILVAIAPLLVCGAVIAGYITFFGKDVPAASRVEPSFGMRVRAWRGVLDMIRLNPVTGTGLGTFALSYPYKKTYGETEIWEQAHNDYLQVICESGLIGFTIFLVGLGFLFRHRLRPLLAGPWRDQQPVLLGAALAVMVLLVHSLVEFNLQIPSNGLLFTLLGGLLLAGHPAEKTDAA
ncbi:MAG TPA: O-antigen ligase family protein, partial [Candidatus Polarisedimenticolia bacterium]|nr:O-antigen ligase family protein [Candidatus Polarisedimenticolia bacterium]